MKTKIFYTIFFSLSTILTNAQGSSDALNYSQTFNGGTARFVSMGGAFGALGGDFTSISINPAGLGVYRSSEFSITPSFKKRNVSSDYNGSNGKGSQNRFGFDNLGFVLSYKPNGEAEKGLINLNIAFGYNRTNDYYTNAYAKGDNSANSIMDYFASIANGNNSDDMSFPPASEPNNTYNPFLDSNAPWEAIMAWNTYLINPTMGTNYEAALNGNDGVFQQNRILNTGSSREFILALGTNYSNKLYIGTTVGITNINYSSSSTFSEDAFLSADSLVNGYYNQFFYSDYKKKIETRGTGYNLKIGVIYKPIDGLRLGLALHTPTFYNLEDLYSYSIHSNFDYHRNEENYYSNSPDGRYEYQLETSLKAIGSIAYTFKDLGLLSIDVEHVSYSSIRLRDSNDPNTFTDANDAIKSSYRNVNNVKIGGEIRISDVFLRGGYAFYPSPYKKGYLNENTNHSIISCGIGYREGNFFIDAAYMYSIQKEKYVLYDLRNVDGSYAVNPVSTKMTEGKFLTTIGFKF